MMKSENGPVSIQETDFVFGSPTAEAAESSSENIESTDKTSLREEETDHEASKVLYSLFVPDFWDFDSAPDSGECGDEEY